MFGCMLGGSDDTAVSATGFAISKLEMRFYRAKDRQCSKLLNALRKPFISKHKVPKDA